MKAQLAVFGATILTVVACGARSSLEVDEPRSHDHDAGADAPPDVEDAGPDVEDAGPDVKDAEPDVVVNDCEEAGLTYVYLITEENDLYAFYPPTKSFSKIGTISCNDPGGGTPFSMAVDRQGVAHVLFNSGHLFRVSTLTGSCKETKFVPGQGGFSSTFGMGFSADANDPEETLYVAADSTPEGLATIDTSTYKLHKVGDFNTQIGNAELTGTGDAKLFGFGVDSNSGSGTVLHLAQIDKTNAHIIDDTFLKIPSGSAKVIAWAFASWGGDFYFFTSTSNGSSSVDRYHPGDPPVAKHYAELNRTVVGAGVSTCAPQQ